MKKLLVAAAAAALFSTGIGAAVAQPSDGDGNYGNYGLCNAYSRGSETGQAQKQAHGQAFIRLAAAAEEAGYDTVAEYCDEFFPKPGKGKG